MERRYCETCRCTVVPLYDGEDSGCSVCGRVLSAKRAAGAVIEGYAPANKKARERSYATVTAAVRQQLAVRGMAGVGLDELTRLSNTEVRAVSGARPALALVNAVTRRTLARTMDGAGVSEDRETSRAEAWLLRQDARAAGKAKQADEMLRRVRARGACGASAAVTEGSWALAAVVLATMGGGCDDPRELALRWKLPQANACAAAIAELCTHGRDFL